MNTKTTVCLLVGVATSLNIAHAQNLIDRSTHLDYTGGLGQSLDWTTFNDSLDDLTLEPSSTKTLTYANSKSGTYLQSPWSASVDLVVTQTFNVTGPIGNFSNISGSLFSQFACANDGPGSGAMASNSGANGGGNALWLEFEIGAAGMNYGIDAYNEWHSAGAPRRAGVSIQKWNGVNAWNDVWTTNSLASGSSVSDTGFLNQGNYRLFAFGHANSIGNDTAFGTATFNLQNLDAVPEPATLGLFALALPALIRRKRK